MLPVYVRNPLGRAVVALLFPLLACGLAAPARGATLEFSQAEYRVPENQEQFSIALFVSAPECDVASDVVVPEALLTLHPETAQTENAASSEDFNIGLKIPLPLGGVGNTTIVLEVVGLIRDDLTGGEGDEVLLLAAEISPGIQISCLGGLDLGAFPLQAGAPARVIIEDDDPLPPLPRLSVEGGSPATEGGPGAAVKFLLRLDGLDGQTARVSYTTVDGTAEAGSDYTATSGQVELSVGQSFPVEVPILDDDEPEGTEEFTLEVIALDPVEVISGEATGVIEDEPHLSIDDVPVGEAAGEAVFTVTLSGKVEGEVRVQYKTESGTAIEGIDYEGRSGTLTFTAAGSEPIPIPIRNDALPEGSETFFVELFNPVGAEIRKGRGTGTIRGADPLPRLAIRDVTVGEGGGTATFRVELIGTAGGPVEVDYATMPGSAVAGSDFVEMSGKLSFPLGITNRTLDITLVDDNLREEDEAFFVELLNPVGAEIENGRGVGTIVDDDGDPRFIIDDPLPVREARGAEVVFRVDLVGQAAAEVRVRFTTAPGTATEGVDYAATSGQLVFPLGTRSQDVRVPVLDDDQDEGNETFFVVLSGAVGAEIAKARGQGTIEDDDNPPPPPDRPCSQVEALCRSGQGLTAEQRRVCARFATLSDPEREQFCEDLAPDEAVAPVFLVLKTVEIQQRALRRRLTSRRREVLRDPDPGPALFGSTHTTTGSGGTPGRGFSFDVSGVDAGFDIPFGANYLLGVVGGYARGTARFGGGDGGDLTADLVSASLFLAREDYFKKSPIDRFFFDAIFTYGWHRMRMRRSLILDEERFTASSNPRGRQKGFSVGGGIDAQLGPSVTLGGYAYLYDIEAETYPYRERGAPLELEIFKQKASSLIGELGLSGSYGIYRLWGGIEGQLAFGYVREREEEMEAPSARLLNSNDPTRIQAPPPTPSDRDYWNLELTLVANFHRRWSIFFNFRKEIGRNDQEILTAAAGILVPLNLRR